MNRNLLGLQSSCAFPLYCIASLPPAPTSLSVVILFSLLCRCTRQTQYANTRVWRSSQVTSLWPCPYLPSSPLDSIAELSCGLQILPGNRSCLVHPSFLCHSGMERTHFFRLYLPTPDRAYLTSVDSNFVENCYLALWRLIMRLNSHISRSDSM